MRDVVVINTEEDMETAEERSSSSSSIAEVVRWENYLPKMVLRVLLVEADDSTRQIISALLRKCSYKVAAVPDGLMAWETLKERPQNIDLILTELDLPSISGFALLTLVMEHESCKNIPVIMMSSQDSISMVLKCMLKGAADFLIKPVRKNELKNLWQHVWRRHALQGGRVHQSLPASQLQLEATAENNAASNKSDKESGMPWIRIQGRASHLIMLLLPKPQTFDAEFVSEKFDGFGTEEGEASDEERPLNERAGDRNIYKMVESSNVTMNLIGGFDNLPVSFYKSGCSNDDISPELELSLRRISSGSSGNQEDNERLKLFHSSASAFSRYKNGNSLPPAFPFAAAGNPTERKTQNESYEPSNKLSGDSMVNSDMQGATTSTNQENIASCVSGQSGQVEPTCQSSQPDITVQPMFLLGSGLSPHGSGANQMQHKSDSSSKTCQSEETANCSIERNSKLKAEKEHECASPVTGQSTFTDICGDGFVSHENGVACGGPAPDSLKGESVISGDGFVSHENGVACGGTAPNSLKGESVISSDGLRGMDAHRYSQREAALAKFRLKRKDRCFEKKVRYQSRKKLAEQRPRVKGQFVRAIQSGLQVPDASGDA